MRGRLEAGQDVVTKWDRLVHRLQWEAVALRPLDPEEVRGASHGQQQIVVSDSLASGVDLTPFEIHVLDFRHAKVGVGGTAEDGADRVGDRGRPQLGRRDLVQQREERVVVVSVDHEHIDRGPLQATRSP